MLEFIKRIFQKEESEVKKAIEIKLQSLEEWFSEKSKPLMEEVNLRISELLMKLSEEIQRAGFNVEVLENAKLQNPNIPFKAKQYMEGNRKAYIKAISSFLGHLEITNKDYFYLLGFCKEFDEMINDLNKGTLRSYTILQEFFANESGEIAKNIKNLDTLFADIKSALSSENMAALNNARQKIQNLKSKARQKINLDIDFKNVEAELTLSNNARESIFADIGQLKKSDDYTCFLKLTEEKKSKNAAFYNDEDQILQSFSVLERPLRKYSHIAFEHEEIVLDYLNHPIETLVSDKELKILDVLRNLEKLLRENEIQVDDKKREKSSEEINKLSRAFIEQFLANYFSFKSKIEELDNKIKASGIIEKLKDFNSKLEDINLKIEKINQEFNKLKDEAAKAANSIETMKSDIEATIKNIFGEEIKVVV